MHLKKVKFNQAYHLIQCPDKRARSTMSTKTQLHALLVSLLPYHSDVKVSSTMLGVKRALNLTFTYTMPGTAPKSN